MIFIYQFIFSFLKHALFLFSAETLRYLTGIQPMRQSKLKLGSAHRAVTGALISQLKRKDVLAVAQNSKSNSLLVRTHVSAL